MLNAPKQAENKWEQENATNQLQEMAERIASEKTRGKEAAKSNALVSHIYFPFLINLIAALLKRLESTYWAHLLFTSSYTLQRNVQEQEQEMQFLQEEQM